MAKAVKAAATIFVVTFLVVTGLASVGMFASGVAAAGSIAMFGLEMAALSSLTTLVGGLMSKGIKATAAENFGSKVATRTATAPRQIIYGKARVGGTITHIETSGTDNYKLSMIVVLAGHEVESLEEVLINDEILTTTSSGGFEYATNSKFVNADNENKFSVQSSLLRYVFVDGSQTTANSNVVNNTSLTSSDKFIGMSYLLIEMVVDSEAFGGGIPPMAFVVKGKKVYDPRTSSTAWSDNPALCVRDYITDTAYGLKATSSEVLDTTSLGGFSAAANICDNGNTIGTATVNGAISSSTFVRIDTSSTFTLIDVGDTVTGTGITEVVKVVRRRGLLITLSSAQTIADGVTLTFTEELYTANGITNMSASGSDVIEGLLSACAGKLSYIDGKFVMFAGASVSPEMTITDDNLLAPISIATKQSSGETFNTVKAVYVDANNNYVATDSPTETPINPDSSVTFLSEDTPTGESPPNYRKTLEIQLPFTDTTTMAQRLQRTALLHTRKEVSLSVLCNIAYMQLQPFDWVYLTNERLGYTNKTFEVLSTNLEVIESDGVPVLATRLALKEIDSSVYAFASSSYTSPIDEGTSVSTGSFGVTAPTNLSLLVDLQLDSTTSKVNIDASWTNNPDDLIQGTEILYGTSSGTYIGSVLVGKGKTKAVIPNLMSNSNYFVVARHFSANNVFSSNTGQQTVNTGLPSAPSEPSSLSATTGKALVIGLEWTAPSNSDLRAVKVYRNTSNFTPTDDNYLVSTITSEPSQKQKLTFGLEDGLTAGTTYHFAVRAINHSGTHSTFTSTTTGSFTLVDAGDIDLPDFSGYFHKEGSTTTALTSAQFNTEYGRTPLNDDILIMVNTSATPKVSKAYKWNGTAFVEINNFTTGDLVVDGTLAGTKIIAQTISADRVDTSFISTLNLLTTSATITNNIVVGTGNAVFKAETGVGIQLGHATFSSAPFSVTEAGVLKAQSGTIGGINLANNKLYVGTGTVNNSNTAFYLDDNGNFSLKDKLYWNGTTLVLDGQINATTGAIGGFDIGTTSIIDDADTFGLSSAVTAGDDVRFFAGDTLANKNTAPFRITEAGNLTATSATITGALTLTNVDGTTVTYTGGNLGVGSIDGTNIDSSSISTSKLLAHATSIINPVSATGNVYRYGGYNDIGTAINPIPSAITLSYNSTENALSLVSDGNTSIRSDSFEIDHNSIYKLSLQIKKTSLVGGGGVWYVGATQFTSFTSGSSSDGGNSQTSTNFGIYNATRTAGTDTTNVYFASKTVTDTNYSEIVVYLIGSEVDIDEVPNHYYSTGIGGSPYVRLASSSTHAGIRILNWSNGTNTKTLLVKNITMAQMTANTIVAENISTTNLAAISADLGSITAGSLNINNVFTVSSSGVMTATSATITGEVNATSGTFNGSISIGSSNSIFKADSNGIYLGNATFGSAPFRVTPTGALTATSGTVGGFTLGATSLTNSSANTKIQIGTGSEVFTVDGDGIYLGNTSFASAPFKALSSGEVQTTKSFTAGVAGTDAIAKMSGTGDYRFWSGSATPSNASFSVDKDGKAIAKNLVLKLTDGTVYFDSETGFSDSALSQIGRSSNTKVTTISTTTDSDTEYEEITVTQNTNVNVTVSIDSNFGGSFGSITESTAISSSEAKVPANFTLTIQHSSDGGTSYNTVVTDEFERVTTTPANDEYKINTSVQLLYISNQGGVVHIATTTTSLGTATTNVGCIDSDGRTTLSHTGLTLTGTASGTTHRIKATVSSTDTSNGTTTGTPDYDAVNNNVTSTAPRVISVTDPSGDGFYVDNGSGSTVPPEGDITGVEITTNASSGLTGGANFTSGDATFNLAMAATIAGNKTFSNNVIVGGNLDVQGTTTTVDTDDLNVKDKNITLNYSTGDSSALSNGAGITIQDAVNGTTNATFLWDKPNSRFTTSHGLNVGGVITIPSSASTEITITGSLAGNITANSDLYLLSNTGTLNLGAGGTNSQLSIATNGNANFTGTITSSGNLHAGDGTNINMDSSANGQIEVDGNGYQGAIALNGSAMHLYHNSSSRNLVLGTNETARLTIGGTGGFNFESNAVQGITTLSSGNITSTGQIISASGGHEIVIGTDGNIEITRTTGYGYIDFKNSTSEDFDQRISATAIGHSFTGDIDAVSLSLNSGGRSDTQEGKEYKYFLTGAGLSSGNWKKVCDVTVGTGLYKSLTLNATLISQGGNFGNTSDVNSSKFIAVFYRSAGTQDNQNNASLTGTNPTKHQLRIIKTATGVYELQILMVSNYADAIVKIHVLSTNGGLITMPTSVVNGSTSGTVYSASTTGTPKNTFNNLQSNNILSTGSVIADTHFTSSDANATLSATGTGNVYLRPNGSSSTSGQVHVASSGLVTLGSINSGAITTSAVQTFTKSVYGSANSENYYRIKLQEQGGVHNDVGIGQTTSGNMGFNVTAGQAFIFNGGTTGNLAYISSLGVDAKQGGFRINGTTVIDSSKNLSSIGTINSGAITTSAPIKVLQPSSSATNELLVLEADDANADIIMTDNTGSVRLRTSSSGDFSIFTGGSATSQNASGSTTALTIDQSQSATFAGTVASGRVTTSEDFRFSGSTSYIRGNGNIHFLTIGGSAQNGKFKSVSAQESYANGASSGMFNALNGYAVGTGVGITVIDNARNLKSIPTAQLTGGSYSASIDTVSDAALVVTLGKSIYSDNLGYLRNLINQDGNNHINIGQFGTSLINNVYIRAGTSGTIHLATNGTDASGFNVNSSGNATAYGTMQANSGYKVGATTVIDSARNIEAEELTKVNKRGNAKRYPLGHYATGDTVFEIDPTWSTSELQDFFESSSQVAWTQDSTAPGGYCVRITGGFSPLAMSGRYIPVDQDDVFYMECWIKNVGTNQTHYMGSRDYNENFSSLGGNPGSYGYWCMSNFNPTTTWTKVSGYIGGFGNNVGQFETGTKYWTPLALFNYGAGTGTRACDISGWKVIRVSHAGNRTFTGAITASGNISKTFDVGSPMTMSIDGSYGTQGTGRYVTLGFSGTSNGSNRIFASNSGSDDIYIAPATSRGLAIRGGGSANNQFRFSPTGTLQQGSTNIEILDQSRNLSNIGTINSGAITATTTSGTALNVNSGTTNVVAKFESGDATAWIALNDSASGTYGALLGAEGGLFRLRTNNNSEATDLTVDTSGNLGVSGTINSGAITSTGQSFLGNTTGITGTSTTATSNVSYLGFYESDKTTRQGYIGYGSNGNTSLYITNDVASSDVLFRISGATRATIASTGNATFTGTITSGAINATASGTDFHILKNASSNGTLLKLLTTGDSREMTFQSDHIFSNGNFYLGSTTYQNIYRGSVHTFEGGVISTSGINLSNGADRSLTGPLNSSLIINARPNEATEGLKLQINGVDKLSILQSGNATFVGQIHLAGSSSIRSNNTIAFNEITGAAQSGLFKSVAAQTSYANGVSDGMFNALNGYAVGTGVGITVIDANRNANFVASSGQTLGVDNADSTTKKGLSLYGSASSGTNPTYGMMFSGTAGSGTHGSVTGDWATYLTMNSSAGRGWIFRNQGTAANVASISNTGNATFDGNLLLDSDNAEINLKSGIGSTIGAVNWTFNTTSTNYASLQLPYATRATTGFHIDSGYPITVDATTRINFAVNGNTRFRITNTDFEVGTTPIIDLNRNLSNIGSITSTGTTSLSSGKVIVDTLPRGIPLNYADSSGWVLYTSGITQTGYYGGNFTINGSTAENQVIHSTLPDGTRGLVWHTPSNDTASNADGGWNKVITGITDSNSYISVVYVRRNGTSTSGTFYHGCNGSHTLNLSGTANTNPYFGPIGIASFPQDVWCISIGYIRANSETSTANSGIGGIYRCDTGVKITSYTDFKMKSGSTEQMHRTYLYYSTQTAASLSWAKPLFYAVDGSEPTLNSLIKKSSTASSPQGTLSPYNPTTEVLSFLINVSHNEGLVVGSQLANIDLSTGELEITSQDELRIKATSIEADKIAANTITANEIAANTITAAEIAADTITGTQINTDLLNVKSFDNVSSTIKSHLTAGTKFPLAKTGQSYVQRTNPYTGSNNSFVGVTISEVRDNAGYVAIFSGVLGNVSGGRVQYSLNNSTWINANGNTNVYWNAGTYRGYTYVYSGQITTLSTSQSIVYWRVYFSGSYNHTQMSLNVMMDNTR